MSNALAKLRGFQSFCEEGFKKYGSDARIIVWVFHPVSLSVIHPLIVTIRALMTPTTVATNPPRNSIVLTKNT